jgi:hypothetical protein
MYKNVALHNVVWYNLFTSETFSVSKLIELDIFCLNHQIPFLQCLNNYCWLCVWLGDQPHINNEC